jgi:hypothetical protein
MKTIATVTLTKKKDCKGSVVYHNESDVAPVSSLYINRIVPEVATAQKVTITIAIEEGPQS